MPEAKHQSKWWVRDRAALNAVAEPEGTSREASDTAAAAVKVPAKPTTKVSVKKSADG